MNGDAVGRPVPLDQLAAYLQGLRQARVDAIVDACKRHLQADVAQALGVTPQAISKVMKKAREAAGSQTAGPLSEGRP